MILITLGLPVDSHLDVAVLDRKSGLCFQPHTFTSSCCSRMHRESEEEKKEEQEEESKGPT